MLNENSVVSNVSGDIEALRNLNNTLVMSIRKTSTSLKYYKNVIQKCGEELYLDDIDQLKDDMNCNICDKEFSRLAIS